MDDATNSPKPDTPSDSAAGRSPAAAAPAAGTPPILCAGGVIHDSRGRLLLIRRGHAPSRGTWSLPGGRVEPGETSAAAAEREVLEETGLQVTAVRPAGSVRLPAPGGREYLVEDWICEIVAGDPRAGDDAEALSWFSGDDIAAGPHELFSPGLLPTLRAWGVLP